MVFHPSVPPPYYACIFTSRRHANDVEDGYAEMGSEMDALAKEQEGYLGIDSVRDTASGLGISVSYWQSEQLLKKWKQHADHLGAQRLGRQQWYDDYHVHIAKVERQYSFSGSPNDNVKKSSVRK